ncbi:MAG: 23S rRNA (adenine(2503)-C(2))-methyltransferase RlmN [Nitrococcus sp.]|nr:23S rRNA (adenine(2503)-C(2))-methyltransferase RlmN [Nitrococcus sp.]
MNHPQSGPKKLRRESGKVNLLGFDREALEGWFAELGEPSFRAVQVIKWIHQRRVLEFERMTDLRKALRDRLAEVAEIRLPRAVLDRTSTDGVRKWLLTLGGDNAIEMVYIPELGRGTLCVSSQLGCPLACTFCSTGQQGFERNLTAAEIIGQLLFATQALETDGTARKLTNVVFMGMGEPLANLTSVLRASNLMLDEHAYNLSRRRVTLSTAGIVPALYRLAEVSRISLAVSLHAPNDALRDELVPINRKYPIAALLAACRNYVKRTPHHRITWEYVMLDAVNDTDAHARELARLLIGIPSKINLIPFNSFPNTCYRGSSPQRIRCFSEILQRAGYITTVRRTRGNDIDGACGQLVGEVRNRMRRLGADQPQLPVLRA